MALVFKNTARVDGVGDMSLVGAAGVTPGVAGKFDYAVQFPGGDVHGYIYTPDLTGVFEPSGSITISYWVRLTAFHNQACHVQKSYRTGTSWTSPWTTFGIQENSTVDGQFAIIMTAATAVILKWTSGASYKIALNTWCHLGAVYDRSANKVYGYLNGALAINQSESRAIDWGSHGPWMIGGDPSPHCASGKIADVRVANVARAASWFSSVWAAGPPSFTQSEIPGRSRAGGDLGGTTAATASDERTTFKTTGGQYFSQPTVGRGTLVANIQPDRPVPNDAQAGLFDGAITSINLPPDYSPLKTDGDGRQYLSDHPVFDLFYYDATQDLWHAPTTPGFYGAGRDGYWYVNGQQAQYGNFGTLAGGFNERSWCRCGGPTVNSEKMSLWWYSGRSSVTLIADDTLRLSLLNGASWESVQTRSSFRWSLSGNFDIQINVANIAPSSGPSDGGFGMEVYVDGENYTYARRHVGGQWDKDVRVNGSWVNYQSVGGAGTSGKLRVVRTSNQISSYYWNGSSWSQIGSTYTGFATGNAYVIFFVGGTGGTYTYTADISAFTINSGTPVYTTGWRREAAGTYRGARPDFPERSLIVTTQRGLDIIDADSNKMWMRFEKGASRMLFDSGTAYPRQAVMRDGCLMVAHGALADGADNGGGINVDFNLDGIFLSQDVASATTGTALRYAEYTSNGWWMNGLPQGIIRGRNAGKGWLPWDWGQYRIQGYRCLGVDIDFSGEYAYRAYATVGGVTVHKWRRWYLEGISSESVGGPTTTYASTAGPIYGCYLDPMNANLFYHTLTTLYRASLATWSATLTSAGNTTFTPDESIALPGAAPEGNPLRVRPRRLSSWTYVCSSAGVYRSSWPAGTDWFLFYGAVGSGAQYELLPPGVVTSYALRVEGGTNYFLVATKSPKDGRILTVIDHDTQTVYARFMLPYEAVSAAA